MSLIVVYFQIILSISRPLEYTWTGVVPDSLLVYYHFYGLMAPLLTSTILQASYNFKLETFESKDWDWAPRRPL